MPGTIVVGAVEITVLPTLVLLATGKFGSGCSGIGAVNDAAGFNGATGSMCGAASGELVETLGGASVGVEVDVGARAGVEAGGVTGDWVGVGAGVDVVTRGINPLVATSGTGAGFTAWVNTGGACAGTVATIGAGSVPGMAWGAVSGAAGTGTVPGTSGGLACPAAWLMAPGT